MALPITIVPLSGCDLNTLVLATDLASGAQRPFARLGTQVPASDGRFYVYSQANASIAASTAVCTVNAATFLATASGGAYTSPAFAMVTGDQGWFSRVAV